MRYRISFLVDAPSQGEAQIVADRVLLSHVQPGIMYHIEPDGGDGLSFDPIEPPVFNNLVDAVLADCESYSLDDDGDREEVARRIVQALEG